MLLRDFPIGIVLSFVFAGCGTAAPKVNDGNSDDISDQKRNDAISDDRVAQEFRVLDGVAKELAQLQAAHAGWEDLKKLPAWVHSRQEATDVDWAQLRGILSAENKATIKALALRRLSFGTTIEDLVAIESQLDSSVVVRGLHSVMHGQAAGHAQVSWPAQSLGDLAFEAVQRFWQAGYFRGNVFDSKASYKTWRGTVGAEETQDYWLAVLSRGGNIKERASQLLKSRPGLYPWVVLNPLAPKKLRTERATVLRQMSPDRRIALLRQADGFGTNHSGRRQEDHSSFVGSVLDDWRSIWGDEAQSVAATLWQSKLWEGDYTLKMKLGLLLSGLDAKSQGSVRKEFILDASRSFKAKGYWRAAALSGAARTLGARLSKVCEEACSVSDCPRKMSREAQEAHQAGASKRRKNARKCAAELQAAKARP